MKNIKPLKCIEEMIRMAEGIAIIVVASFCDMLAGNQGARYDRPFSG